MQQTTTMKPTIRRTMMTTITTTHQLDIVRDLEILQRYKVLHHGVYVDLCYYCSTYYY